MIHDAGVSLTIKNNAQCNTIVVLFITEDETVRIKTKQQWGPAFIDLGEKEIVSLQIEHHSPLLKFQWTGSDLLFLETTEGWKKTVGKQFFCFELPTSETIYKAVCRLKIKTQKVTSLKFTMHCRRINPGDI